MLLRIFIVMYSEEMTVKDHTLLLSICFLFYTLSIIFFPSLMTRLLSSFIYVCILYHLGFKIYFKFLIFILCLIFISSFDSLLFFLLGFVWYIFHLPKRSILKLLAFVCPNEKILYQTLLFGQFFHDWYLEILFSYQLSKEFSSKFFFRHFFFHLRLSGQSAYNKACDQMMVYKRLFYGYSKKR